MSDAQLLVSLLDPQESDHLLRVMHRVLRPADAEHVALVQPPEPELALAALRITGASISIITIPGRHLVAENRDDRVYVWCRDELEAEALQAQPGKRVVAATVEELAWELVRRLKGDLRDMVSQAPAVPATAKQVPYESTPATHVEPPEPPHPQSAEAPAAADGPSTVVRGGRVPATPSWARIGGTPPPRAAPASAAPPPNPEAMADSLPGAPPYGAVRAASDAPPVATPLSALARHLPSNSVAGPQALYQSTGNETSADRGQQRWSRVRELIGRGSARLPSRAGTDLSALGQALFRAHSTVVTVGTPKGGPGKTTEAAALGVLGARAVEPHGGSAVLVDANLNNPDSWRQLAVPSDAITVREIVDALNRGALVPNGEFARNERLRVLPERRSGGSEYSAAEITRLVEHLRLRHTLVIVDLPNTLPGLGEGSKEALVAHWLQHADVTVLPIDLGEASFIAVGEILDAIEEMVTASGGRMRMPGVVVPLLVPGDGRRALELPAIAELLDHLRDAGATVVEVPFTVDVQTASHRRRPIVGASPQADRAFVGVLSAVVAARQVGEQGRRPRG